VRHALIRSARRQQGDRRSDRRRGHRCSDRRACARRAVKWIAINAGFEGAVMVREVERAKGTRASTLSRASSRLVKAGIIDPAKVTRSALQNAASIAALLLTRRRLSPTSREVDNAAAAMAGAGGGMGMM